MDTPSPVKTLNRLVEILDSFSPHHSEWSLAELSEHLDIPRSTLYRLLIALEAHGILQRDPRHRRWRLGDIACCSGNAWQPITVAFIL
jgi:DNA-binding IclR family transcriptional regulator